MAGSGGGGEVDLSKMSDRDRRIYLRDLERKNRANGGGGNAERAYGAPQAPPAKVNIFGKQEA